MIFLIPNGYVFFARTFYGKVFIGDTPLKKYIPKYIKPTSNINSIERGWETFISAMLLQSDINKWSLLQLEKIDKLYLILHQPEFYKYLRFISMKKRIKYFQISQI